VPSQLLIVTSLLMSMKLPRHLLGRQTIKQSAGK